MNPVLRCPAILMLMCGHKDMCICVLEINGGEEGGVTL